MTRDTRQQKKGPHPRPFFSRDIRYFTVTVASMRS